MRNFWNVWRLLKGGLKKMVKSTMGLNVKRRALKKLIEDAETLKFNPKLIKDYKRQLAEIEDNIKANKLERERLKEERDGT